MQLPRYDGAGGTSRPFIEERVRGKMMESLGDLAAGHFSANGLDAQTTSASEAIADKIGASEWLGPLAPVALSPFFGLCVLSGIATYGPDWLQNRSGLFTESSLLASPYLFWTMLALAILTSLPRLTKVSKPIALFAENVESYSAVIILIAVRMLGAPAGAEETPTIAHLGQAGQPAMLSAGFATVSLNLVLSAFAAFNVLVINGVKLAFEFFVWLIPFPTVDAILEGMNKSMCVALMGIYCYSPVLATVLNLLLLTACLFVFGWARRRVRYYRQILIGPLLAKLFPRWFAQRGDYFTAFSDTGLAGLPRYTPVRIAPRNKHLFHIEARWLWRRVNLEIKADNVAHETGIACETLCITDSNGQVYMFLHRRWVPNDTCYVDENPTTEPAPI